MVLDELYSDSYQLRGGVCFVKAASKADLAEIVNCGFASCHVPIVHILACGMEASPAWAETALAHFADSEIAAVYALVLNRLDHGKVVSAGVSYRASGSARRLGFGKSPDKAMHDKKYFSAPISWRRFTDARHGMLLTA